MLNGRQNPGNATDLHVFFIGSCGKNFFVVIINGCIDLIRDNRVSCTNLLKYTNCTVSWIKMTRIPGRKVSLTTNLSMKSYNPGPRQWSLVERGLSPFFLKLNFFCRSLINEHLYILILFFNLWWETQSSWKIQCLWYLKIFTTHNFLWQFFKVYI